MADPNADKRSKTINDARTSLVRMQTFDPGALPRIGDLGSVVNFVDAVEPATRLIGLYQQLSPDVLDALPVAKLNQIKSSADSDFNRLDAILQFEPGTAKSERDNLIQQLWAAYDPAFETLNALISYSVRHSTDFEKLGRNARAVIQGVQDEAGQIKDDLAGMKGAADSALREIKRVAAEQGVSQQAIHFKNEGDSHAEIAGKWLTATIWVAVGLGVYSISTLFLHKIPWFTPETTFETIQLSVSKALIFGTILFALALCARNYLAHRHNAVVNKHRQNALATYTAIVKAANEKTNSDIVLNRAAECIFSPQQTGYSKGGADQSPMSFVTFGPNSVRAPGT